MDPIRVEHTDQTSAGLHILLTVAMKRLGINVLTATEKEYREATAGFGALRLTFDDDLYRAEKVIHTGDEQ